MPEEITLDSIFAKDAEDLTEEEVQHLNNFKSQLTDEHLEKYDSVLTDDEEEGKSAHATETKEEEQKPA